MLELIDVLKIFLVQYLGNIDPVNIQEVLSKTPFLAATCQAQAKFSQNKALRQLFFKVLSECGVELPQCYYDHFSLRIIPFAKQHSGAKRSAIAHHRDTWGSNIHCQQNWWAPIFNLTEERTIAFYPDYWHKPIANTTSSWSFEKLKASRETVLPERSISYPMAPNVTEKVDETNMIKVLLQPGDVLNFSSAHLHASVPNTSNATRYSVEMRTINLNDLHSGLQASNLDNAGKSPMYSWFKNIITKKQLFK